LQKLAIVFTFGLNATLVDWIKALQFAQQAFDAKVKGSAWILSRLLEDSDNARAIEVAAYLFDLFHFISSSLTILQSGVLCRSN